MQLWIRCGGECLKVPGHFTEFPKGTVLLEGKRSVREDQLTPVSPDPNPNGRVICRHSGQVPASRLEAAQGGSPGPNFAGSPQGGPPLAHGKIANHVGGNVCHHPLTVGHGKRLGVGHHQKRPQGSLHHPPIPVRADWGGLVLNPPSPPPDPQRSRAGLVQSPGPERTVTPNGKDTSAARRDGPPSLVRCDASRGSPVQARTVPQLPRGVVAPSPESSILPDGKRRSIGIPHRFDPSPVGIPAQPIADETIRHISGKIICLGTQRRALVETDPP